MDDLVVKYHPYEAALPPRPIKIVSGGWAGPPVKMEDGSDPQPWHCLPFVEGNTYGLELVYPYEKECHVVNDAGNVRFDWDFASEPGGGVTGGEFGLFSPVAAAKYYLFNTRLDIQPPPGFAVRTEPHPRFFTDDAGTVPCAIVGHLQNEWYPRLTFIVFRAPRPGARHIFRKGEPFVQLLFVPARVNYDIQRMTPEEAGERRALESAIQHNRLEIAEHRWHHPDGGAFNNHYKLLARAFARDGLAGVKQIVREAAERRAGSAAKVLDVSQSLTQASQLVDRQLFEQAQEVLVQILNQDPNNTEALCLVGICCACRGNMIVGETMMARAVALRPDIAKYHSNLAELLRRMARYQEAEMSIRTAIRLSPTDPNLMGVLGLILVHQGRVADGFTAYQKSTALGASLPGTHLNMGLLMAQSGNHDAARACYQAALAVAPNFHYAQQALQDLPKPVESA